jgi:hypothetical protein
LSKIYGNIKTPLSTTLTKRLICNKLWKLNHNIHIMSAHTFRGRNW